MSASGGVVRDGRLRLRNHTEVSRRTGSAYLAYRPTYPLQMFPAGYNVQHRLLETSPEDEAGSNSAGSNCYVSVVSLACTRFHFIRKETGKLLPKNQWENSWASDAEIGGSALDARFQRPARKHDAPRPQALP